MIQIRWLGGEPKRPPRFSQPVISAGFPYSYWWKATGRQHQRCRLLARGAKDSVLVEFEDGFTMVTGRYALRIAKPQ